MSPKIYTQKFKDIVVKYYECNHTIKETKDHFKVTSVSFFVGFFDASVTAQPERNRHIVAINAATSRIIFLFIKHTSFFIIQILLYSFQLNRFCVIVSI